MNVSLWKHPILQIFWRPLHTLCSSSSPAHPDSSNVQTEHLLIQRTCSSSILNLPLAFSVKLGGLCSQLSSVWQQTRLNWRITKYVSGSTKKKRPEKANLYIQVLQEDSMNCTVFHSKQVGATATIKKGEDTTSSNMHLVWKIHGTFWRW